jgi:peptidoglycan hydrolase-like protein with peptidoglycan-binding domain
VFALLCSLSLFAPALASAAGDVVAVDSKVLASAKVERNGKQVGSVQRVMVNPTSGRIEHVDIVMNEGQQRVIAVPWSGLRVFQDNGGNITLSLTSRAASEASPSASPSLSASTPAPANNVATAQQRLKDDGYYSGTIDGVLGPNTVAALRAYQRDHRLSVTGRLDSPTVRSLMSETRMASAPTPPSPAMDVFAVQRELKRHGFYAGPIDGVIGTATEAALRAYQRDRGLTVTGRLDAPTVRSLSS